MPRFPDLVRDTKLDTVFDGPFTVHNYDDSDDENNSRSTHRSEYWESKDRLAQGGFGEVWLQKCEQGQRGPSPDLRAVKVIQRSSFGNKNLDYINELEAIAKFSQKRYSKCFVKLLGWYEDPKRLFIAMEYFDVGDLQKYMSSNDPMPEGDAQEVVYQILHGLYFMHREGFAHRDVKPANILIKAQPPKSKWWVKLSDFGISKRIEEATYVPSTIKGTPPYMAPELVLYEPGSSSPINHQIADMWALGEISFRMLTKNAAFVDWSAVVRYVVDPTVFPSHQLHQYHIGPEANSFIRSVLEPRVGERLSADKALKHAWIKPCRTAASYQRPVTGPWLDARLSNHSPNTSLTSVSSSGSQSRKPAAGLRPEAGLSNVSPDPWATLESAPDPRDKTLRPLTRPHSDARISESNHIPASSSDTRSRKQTTGHCQNPGASADDDDAWWEAPSSASTVCRLAVVPQIMVQEGATQSNPRGSVVGSTKQIDMLGRSSDTTIPSSRKNQRKAAASAVTDPNLVIVGDGACGKTCLLIAFFDGTFPKYYVPHLFGCKIVRDFKIDGKHVELALWDTSDYRIHERRRRRSYAESDVIVTCFAIDSPDSLDNVQQKWVSKALPFRRCRPVMLVGCKKDLRYDTRTIEKLRKTNQHPVTHEEGEEVGRRIGAYKYLECSAKTNEGIKEVFEHATRVAIL